MKRKLLFILTVLFVVSGYSQQEPTKFSTALYLHLPKYKKQADKAYRVDDLSRAHFLFDSLVQFSLKGSRLDNFRVKNLKRKDVYLKEFKNPIYLTTYASWIVPTEGEIPAINNLADKYAHEIDFIMLFWDKRQAIQQLSKKYSKNITILYVDELQNSHSAVIKMMKHSLGIPVSFVLDKDKVVVDITRKVSHPFGIEFEKSYNLNYNAVSKSISEILLTRSEQLSQRK